MLHIYRKVWQVRWQAPERRHRRSPDAERSFGALERRRHRQRGFGLLRPAAVVTVLLQKLRQGVAPLLVTSVAVAAVAIVVVAAVVVVIVVMLLVVLTLLLLKVLLMDLLKLSHGLL